MNALTSLSTQLLPALLAASLIFGVILFRRVDGRRQCEVRAGQLERSTMLLSAHLQFMEAFLTHSDAPATLKGLLIQHSDAMADEQYVYEVVRSLASQRRPAVADDVAGDIASAFQALQAKHPDLAEQFAASVTTGTLGASLRWQHSAALFEEVTAGLVADPKRDLDVIATTSTYRRPGLPYALGQSAAMA